MKRYDFVIIGGGVIGLTIARALSLSRSGSICVLEKESALGTHTSGRNSGVLHAGIYYAPDSLKARFCAAGAQKMREYAAEHNIPCKKVGKVIVAPDAQAHSRVNDLYMRGLANGVNVKRVNVRELAQIEPEAFTHEEAIYSPDTAIIDIHVVIDTLEKELAAAGVAIQKNSQVVTVNADARLVSTPGEKYNYGHLINAAGLHADKIAHQMGIGSHYRILPFKGMYKKLRREAAARFNGLIYPVPDPAFPFLGVHLTRSLKGDVWVGPTALPAFGRENYKGAKGLDLLETPAILFNLGMMSLANHDGFLPMVREELSKLSNKSFYDRVKVLAPFLKEEDIEPCDKVGIRAQLIDVRTRKLVMDFLVEKGPSSTHILNAVSPGFTCSMVFAEKITESVLRGTQVTR